MNTTPGTAAPQTGMYLKGSSKHSQGCHGASTVSGAPWGQPLVSLEIFGICAKHFSGGRNSGWGLGYDTNGRYSWIAFLNWSLECRVSCILALGKERHSKMSGAKGTKETA